MDQIFWEWLTRYKEVLVNGLNLVSFLLITPELRRMVPVGRLPLFTFYAIIVAVFLYLLVMRLDDVVELLALRSIPAPLVEAVMWAALGLGILLFIVLQQGLLHFSGAFSAHAFGLGAALFFFSRLIAFMAAGHEILAPAGASPHH